jgi:hypothetical protein
MRSCTALLSIVVGLIGCCTSVAQVFPGEPEVTAWQLFLLDVAALNHSVPADPPVKPPLQKALGLTDQESDALKAVAADYEMKNSLFLKAVRPLKMEALLQSLDSGKVAENLTRRIGELQNEHTRMISDQIQRLRNALGDPRFEVLNTLVRAKIPR